MQLNVFPIPHSADLRRILAIYYFSLFHYVKINAVLQGGQKAKLQQLFSVLNVLIAKFSSCCGVFAFRRRELT